MRQLRSALFCAACAICVAACSPLVPAQRGSVSVDWKAELKEAQAGIKKDPNSAFWHNQAGVAYDALGHFEHAVKELKLASTLDPTNPIHDYVLYPLYKKKGMRSQGRKVLLKALEKDSANPLGHFEFGYVLEKEGYLVDSLREYGTAKQLVVEVKGPEYIDRRGNPFDIGSVREEVDKAIDRVAKLIASKQSTK